MCGIAGLLSLKEPIAAGLIETMTRTIRYRGPDDEGYLAVDTQSNPTEVTPLIGPDSTIRHSTAAGDFRGAGQTLPGSSPALNPRSVRRRSPADGV